MVDVEVKEGIEAVKEAKKYFGKKPDLLITDVPTKALNQFKKLANEEFKPKNGSAHYGYTLKFLLDFYFGKIIDGASVAQEIASEALERVTVLEGLLTEESEGQEKNPKIKKMIDGTEMRCF